MEKTTERGYSAQFFVNKQTLEEQSNTLFFYFNHPAR